ncbi:MAG: site-2 protease family protein [Endomicrobium sp.]|jgi:regulator of sigma E protease|nr:site-2 protease family protein [Endomicrobium sp.]
MTIFLQAFSVIVGIGFLVFIHELGHFIAAKICKVKVLTFAFGLGPDLIKKTHNGTKYCIKLIPFGGFVAMAGENPYKVTGLKDEYLSLKWYKKIFVAFSGSFLNYIFAIFIFAMFFSMCGISVTSKDPFIGSTIKNYPAALSGLMSGDKIKSIDGVKINAWNDLNINLKNKVNKMTSFIVERRNNSFQVNIFVQKNPATQSGIIGINPVLVKMKIGFFRSFYLGLKVSIAQTTATIMHLWNKIISFENPDVVGPVGVIHIMLNAFKNGICSYIKLIAFISIALGLFNLLPIPMLDGGMIMLFFVEGIRKKQLKMRFIQIYNMIGLIFVIVVFAFATWNDLARLSSHNYK